MLVGRPLASRLQYEFAVTNGSGTAAANDNVDLAYTARIVAAPFGPLPMSEGDFDGTTPRAPGGVAGTTTWSDRHPGPRSDSTPTST